MTVESGERRRWLQAAAGAALWPLVDAPVQAQQGSLPIADMHSHFGIIRRTLASAELGAEMRSHHVALLAWKMVADSPWLRRGPRGIDVVGTPEQGKLAARFDTQIARMKSYLREQKLKIVLSPADVDACVAPGGTSGVVLAAEGAHFLEGDLGRLPAARDKGLRHLQLVHFVPSPVGDNQTLAPVHRGLSAMGKQLIESCNEQRVLIDLAHASMDCVEQALQISKTPLVWSHGWVDRVAGRWLDATTHLQRRLSIAHAKMIADKGGVIGLWAGALLKPGPAWAAGRGSWTVGLHDTEGYAREIANLVDKLGADHVAFGTDMEGLGDQWAVDDYAGVRTVLDQLQTLKLSSDAIEHVAFRNYARVLKAAL